MVRDVRVKQYVFSPGSLTSASTGLFNVYSENPINGTIKSVVLQDNNFTTTGSLLIFSSGLHNSGTNLGELVITLRAGSANEAFYPITYGRTNQTGTGSPQAFTEFVVHSTLRLVGSGLGDTKSGLGLIINYI